MPMTSLCIIMSAGMAVVTRKAWVGDQISSWAQIVSLADVYDALVSKRCYKNALALMKHLP